MTKLTVACIQTNSKREPADNLAEIGPMIREAAGRGAELITTPEIVGMFEPRRRLALAKARPEQDHEVLAGFRGLAAELGRWLLIGSLSVKLSADRLANRSFLIDPSGRIAARYDKIHMFDVQVGDGQTYRESGTYRPGAEAVIAETPWGRVGLSVCYDLRFPHLYRALAQAGAGILFIPAAFTRVTGAAHWHVLLRARAIETGCFVLAPAQCGDHAEGRQTYGHSLIVAPWGEVLDDGGTEPGVRIAELDLTAVATARAKVPALTHDRPFSGPSIQATDHRAAGD